MGCLRGKGAGIKRNIQCWDISSVVQPVFLDPPGLNVRTYWQISCRKSWLKFSLRISVGYPSPGGRGCSRLWRGGWAMSDWDLVRCGNVPALLPMAGSHEAPIPLSPHDLKADDLGHKYIKLSPRSPSLMKFLTAGTGRAHKAPTGRNHVSTYVRTFNAQPGLEKRSISRARRQRTPVLPKLVLGERRVSRAVLGKEIVLRRRNYAPFPGQDDHVHVLRIFAEPKECGHKGISAETSG